HDLGIPYRAVYRGDDLPGWEEGYIFGTWSRSFGSPNGTLLVATPPSGVDLEMIGEDASQLTPSQNRMWETHEIQVMNNENNRINAFVRALNEDPVTHEVYLLINRNTGPGSDPQESGQVWRLVPSNTPGLVDTDTAEPMPPSGGGESSSGGGY
ncbi:MAG: hypothetical protein RQ758_03235, partial [Methanomicrobiaceae archaeon]|nr:hypothetical protein [Methanomicrobiaceae archaeon]